MTLSNEFLSFCANAQTVTTIDGPALLLGSNVVQFRGSDSTWAGLIAEALRMIPQEPKPPVEQELSTETADELVARIDTLFREIMRSDLAKDA